MPLDIAAVQKALAERRPRRLAALRLPRIESDRRQARGPGRQAHDAAVVLLHPGVGHAEESSCTRSSRSCSTALPGDKTDLRRPPAARAGRRRDAPRREGRRHGVLAGVRHSLPLARGRRDGRVHPPARDARRLVGRSRAAASRRRGTTAQIATHRAASEKLYRIKDRAFEYVGAKLVGRRRRCTSSRCRSRWSSGSGKRASSPTPPPIVGGAGERRQSRTTRRRATRRGRFGPTSCCCSISGASWTQPGVGLRRHHVDGLRRRRRRPRSRKAFAAIVRGPRCGGRQGEDRGRRRRSRFTAGRSTGRPATSSRRPASATSSSIGPATAWARKCTATACTWTTTKRTTTAGSCRAPGSRSSQGSTRQTFGVRTEINMVVGEQSAEVTGPCQQNAGQNVTAEGERSETVTRRGWARVQLVIDRRTFVRLIAARSPARRVQF